MKTVLKRVAPVVIPSRSTGLHRLKSRTLYREVARIEGYFAQYGQDQFLDREVFRGQTGGVFVDVGANDGVSFSNTLFFETSRDWRGLCIEPHPLAYESLVRSRSCHCFNGTTGPASGTAQFLQLEGYCEMLSGLVDQYSADHLARVERDLAIHGGQKALVEIRIERFASLMHRYDISAITFLKIDTEGSELAILKEIFSTERAVSVVSVENSYYSSAIYRFLRGRGFRLIARIGDDEIYRHRSFR